MPRFLVYLGRSLTTVGDDSRETRRQAKEHGDQRWDAGWSVIEVVRDYQILRLVVTEFLEEALHRRLESREALVLNVAIDDAIAAAVSAFVASQSVPGAAATSTRKDAADLLLNVLGTVGHELRNPLAPLATSVEVLRLASNDASQIEKVRQMMDRQIRLLGRLVDDLMDLPRLARGKMSLRRERLDLAQLVRSCAEDRRTSLESSGLLLTIDVPNDPVWVNGDETRLTQAFGNLIGNAQKFTDRGGSVNIRLTVSAGTRAFVAVSDTGIGIPAAVLPLVFEAYVQADRTLERSRGGLGLGLALVKGVVELHGGSVIATSGGLGTGASFTVELPLTEPHTPPEKNESSSDTVPGQARRVLIIEDNTDSAESMKMYLELFGHVVGTARNGPDGIRIAEQTKPEVVICDVGLPGLDGFAVAAELRRMVSPRPALIIAVTGHGGKNEPDDQRSEAFDFYLLKPVDPTRILRLLAQLTSPQP